MGKRNRQSTKAPGTAEGDDRPFNAALSGLAALRAQLGASALQVEAPVEPEPDLEQERPEGGRASKAAPPSSGAYVLKGKLALHKEKKGRGGKTATRVSGFQLEPEGLAALAKDMKRQLGCGAVVEGRDIVLLGDLTQRAAEWLRAHGAKRVVGD